MLEYLKTYGNISFADAPVNDVDRLIFAQCAYFNFGNAAGVRGGLFREALEKVCFEACDYLSEQRFFFQQRDDRHLCTLLRACARYENIRFQHFANAWDEDGRGQFAALSLILPDGELMIAFRGTDNTISGWKEDFDLAFKEEVPAQQMARAYTLRQSEGFERVHLCGHSKGGHLAFYAAVSCADELGSRLIRAVSFDGPGLSEKMAASAEFARVQEKMFLYRPRASLVGLLFCQPEQVSWVENRSVSLLQHYPYAWKTDGMDFLYAQRQSLSGEKLGQTVCGLLSNMDMETRERVVETIYELIAASGAQTVKDLIWNPRSDVRAVLHKVRSLDRNAYLLVWKVIRAFLASAAETFGLSRGEKTD